MLALAAACAADVVERGPKLSAKETEDAMAKMFSDTSGTARFSCAPGDGRHEYICQGRYVPIDRTQPAFAQRIGVSVSHYFEGKPEFAIAVLRDGAAKK